MDIRVPSEFSRATRPMDEGSWKAVEYRNAVLWFFPAVVRGGIRTEREQSVWLQLAWVFRANCLPPDEFLRVPNRMLKGQQDRLQSTYQATFGPEECTYNFHHLSHLGRLREHGPLPIWSAFAFEACFALMRRSYVAGTPNVPLQALREMYMRTHLGHSCKHKIRFRTRATEKYDDTLCYTHTAEDAYSFFKITSVDEERQVLTALRIVVCAHQHLGTLSWQKVGVFRRLQTQQGPFVELCFSDIAGKAICVLEFIMTCPKILLFES